MSSGANGQSRTGYLRLTRSALYPVSYVGKMKRAAGTPVPAIVSGCCRMVVPLTYDQSGVDTLRASGEIRTPVGDYPPPYKGGAIGH